MSSNLQSGVASEFSSIDKHFSNLMCRLGNTADKRLRRVFARLSQALANQHSCLDLLDSDESKALINALHQLPIVSNTAATPLVLEGSKLYMQRYQVYETRIAARLSQMNNWISGTTPDATAMGGRLADMSITGASQKLAVLCALSRQLTIITGGPGTGKTTTVARIIDALTTDGEAEQLNIRLAAPTGKAAMRMRESLSGALPGSTLEVSTLHRLLGVRPNGGGFRYHADNLLPVDLLVVDEVSMIDLAMMYRLLAALPRQARLILLGDPDQLPSVEAGNILGDMCKYPAGYSAEFANFAHESIDLTLSVAETNHRLRDAVCHLTESYRFADDRGIGKLSTAIRENAPWRPEDDEVQMKPISALNDTALLECFAPWLEGLAKNAAPDSMLAAFERARILAPVREGEYGVIQLNSRIEQRLAEQGVIDVRSRFYHGRPILVTRNDYNLRLFNGDVGLCIHRGDGEPQVVFRDASGDLKTYLASRLPPHETCFAMTVHKSQGSEFNHVVLALAPVKSSGSEALLTRELLYTAVTRARQHVSIYCDREQLVECLANRSVRHSGLGERFLVPGDSF